MSPDQKRSLRKSAAWVGIIITLLTISWRSLDTRYVHTTDYRLDRQRDSLTHNAEVRDIYRSLASLDSTDRCRRGLSQYCR